MDRAADHARLAELLRDAESDLQLAAGGGAVCVFTKAGTPVPGIKYHEGRRAALKDVLRRSRTSSDEIAPLAAQVRATWAEDLERLTQRGAGPDWVAYRTGGVDALTELSAALGPRD